MGTMIRWPSPEVEPPLDELRREILDTLPERVIGLDVSGSLVVGAFDPDTSDVDLLAVLTEAIDKAKRAKSNVNDVKVWR